MPSFVVQLRDIQERRWGTHSEVAADSAKQAAEQVAGEPLHQGSGARADLRARVWPTPFGSQPDIPFYVAVTNS